MTSAESAGVYAHVPFCSAICPYCDFAVLVGGPERRAAYVDAVLAELALDAVRRDAIRLGPFDTVYLGGGTPSALDGSLLPRLLDGLRATLPLHADTLWYLEANPEDVTPERLAAWRAAGVGTLSLGVQAFDDAALRFLGRRHDAATATRATEEALAAGFETVSIDLIYGLPSASFDDWRRTLDRAIALAPDHLSCYQLTVEPRTRFGQRAARGETLAAPEPAQARLFRHTHGRLAEAGYDGYEVSNFARGPDHRSRHNRKYWHHVPYLGLGPSAHSFDGRRRWWNDRHLGPWSRRIAAGERPIAARETLRASQMALERLMLGLRTRAGIDLDRFAARYDIDLVAANRAALPELVGAGLVTLDDGRLRPTLDGLAVADGLAARLSVD